MKQTIIVISILFFSKIVHALPDTFEHDLDESILINAVEQSIIILVFSNTDYHPYKLEKYAEKRRRMAEMIVMASKENNVPALLVTPMVYFESRFYTEARGKIGEIGLMQVHGVAARNCELKTAMGQLQCGTRYLRKLIDTSCAMTLETALSAYVSGQCVAYGKIEDAVQKRINYYANLRNRFCGQFQENPFLDQAEPVQALPPPASETAVVSSPPFKPEYQAIIQKAYDEYMAACARVECHGGQRCVPENGAGKCEPL